MSPSLLASESIQSVASLAFVDMPDTWSDRDCIGRRFCRTFELAKLLRAEPRCSLDCSFISLRSNGVDLATLLEVESLLMKVTIFC